MEWTDITEQFKLSVSELSLGAMVSSPLFRLDDAMSSIELMEPRMDPGCDIKNKDMKLKKTRDNLLSRSFSETGQVAVIDMLIGLVYNWLLGNLYIQTVHSTIFMIDRGKLRDGSLRYACNEVFELSCDLRSMMLATGVCDEEDFIGFMFGFNEDKKDGQSESSPEVMHSDSFNLRMRFISTLREIIIGPISLDLDAKLNEMARLIEQILDDINTSSQLDSSESDLISASIDPSVHRVIMPPGPPRRVAPVKAPEDIYADWTLVFASIKKGLSVLNEEANIGLLSEKFSVSFFSLFNGLGKLRQFSNFRFSLVRAVLYHRVYYGLDIPQLVNTWVSVCNVDSPELPLFCADLSSVIHKVVYTLFRSASRQQRRLKHVLKEVSIMQHRAWELCITEDKSLWSFVALIGSYLVQLNLVLNLELNLVDLSADAADARLVYFLLETVTGVKLYITNTLAGKMPVGPVMMDLRTEILASAVEHYLAKSMGQLACTTPVKTDTSVDCARLFELRALPLMAFPLPTSVALEDFNKWMTTNEYSSAPADECLLWIDRAIKTGSNVDGPMIANDLAGVKRTLLSNKITLMKEKTVSNMKTNHKYHSIAISLVLP